jgi:hypothetical protein
VTSGRDRYQRRNEVERTINRLRSPLVTTSWAYVFHSTVTSSAIRLQIAP